MERQRKPEEAPEFRFSPRPNRADEINWHPWDDAAFAEAQREGRPIFLSISAFWCHWCHVMDETTYSDTRVIELLNDRYVPVRVDTDKRPDVNRRYNQGGWPSFDILAPTGEILVGGTYIAPDEANKLLTQVWTYYTTHKDEIGKKIEEARLELAQIEAQEEVQPQGALTEHVVCSMIGLLKNAYDPTYGGFNQTPKFPHVDALDFLLENYYRTKDLTWLGMVTNTLDHIIEGGLFDKVAGGFFRYSTTREWSVPHYEKMLEENAQLVSLCLKASQMARNEEYQRVARRTLAYLDSTLLDRTTGCFFGSQDAEEQYYLLPRQEREKRAAPFVDTTIYTDWNALATKAYLDAYRLTGEEEYLRRALHVLDFLWSNCRQDSQGMYHYWNGQPNLLGLLIDQLRMAASLLEAYEVTSRSLYLQRAEKLADIIQRDFFDEIAGGFFDTALSEIPGAMGRLRARDKSIIDNSAAADLYLALYALTGKETYHILSERALKTFLDDYPQYGLFAASYAQAVDNFLHGPVRLTVVGRRQRQRTQTLLKESLKVYAPATVVELLDTERDARKIEGLGYATGPIPAVYVCHKQTCSAPLENAEDIKPVVDSIT